MHNQKGTMSSIHNRVSCHVKKHRNALRRTCMAVVGSADYLQRFGVPLENAEQLGDQHRCINMPAHAGGLYAWEFERDGRARVRVDGQLILSQPAPAHRCRENGPWRRSVPMFSDAPRTS